MNSIILFSGGLDSTVMLAMALSEGKNCFALSFDYNQRHIQELTAAKTLASYYAIPHQIVKIDAPSFTNSGLLSNVMLPQGRTAEEIRKGGVPSTYVPGRNALFLAYAMSHAEILQADEIYFGCNILDQEPYVDCRPIFIEAFRALLKVATAEAVHGKPTQLLTPLMQMDKKAIVKKGRELNVPLEATWSCYSPSFYGKPCQLCDACRLRNEGFKQG